MRDDEPRLTERVAELRMGWCRKRRSRGRWGNIVEYRREQSGHLPRGEFTVGQEEGCHPMRRTVDDQSCSCGSSPLRKEQSLRVLADEVLSTQYSLLVILEAMGEVRIMEDKS
jgi:hypothetical protein